MPSGAHLSESHFRDFHEQGVCVFRGIIPPSLVEELRAAVPSGAAQVRASAGPQAQRFQPVQSFDIPQRPFQDFLELPALNDAIQAVLTPRHSISPRSFMGVLIEPVERPYRIAWHRDFVRPWFDLEQRAKVDAHLCDLDYFNQSNAALYDDDCLWLVPGSQHRAGRPHELRIAAQGDLPGPPGGERSAAEEERRARAYVASMPGATQVCLAAGDFALYRQNLWHSACYVPYRRRATLHNHVDTPEFASFMKAWTWRPKADAKAPEAA